MPLINREEKHQRLKPNQARQIPTKHRLLSKGLLWCKTPSNGKMAPDPSMASLKLNRTFWARGGTGSTTSATSLKLALQSPQEHPLTIGINSNPRGGWGTWATYKLALWLLKKGWKESRGTPVNPCRGLELTGEKMVWMFLTLTSWKEGQN